MTALLAPALRLSDARQRQSEPDDFPFERDARLALTRARTVSPSLSTSSAVAPDR